MAKKAAYKLKDLSYLGLSLNYLAMIGAIVIMTIVIGGMNSTSGNWIWFIVTIVLGSGTSFYIYQTGIKYGQYGLIISMAKLLQPKTIKNDYPLFADNLIVRK